MFSINVKNQFSISCVQELKYIKSDTGNIDVIIHDLIGLSKYQVTFFSLNNVRELMNGYKSSGECLSGSYFWSSNMVILSEMSLDKIIEVSGHLINSGEIVKVGNLCS